MALDAVPSQKSRWAPWTRVELHDGDAGLKICFSSESSVRATKPLPLRGSCSWRIKIESTTGYAVVGVCNSKYDKWGTTPSLEENAWVLSTGMVIRVPIAAGETRHWNKVKTGEPVLLSFDADARTLSFGGDFPQIEPLRNITGDSLYPVVGGSEGAIVHVLHAGSAASIPDAFPSLASYIGSCLEETEDADVVIAVGSEEVLAHSLLLKRIPYFQRMLNGRFAESRKRKLQDRDSESSHRYRIVLEDVEVD
eukprot:CAMPEP_0197644774 /NCGR_PEP_ID=MMETSP1338-20131121/17640_1 /TAXON_ID=43686 ORGANISM="Pelagodinium beii, Strain RCC1491" /NCGR_SAMPLE_ID=MMETSP1338 /ASSEMBLY_ACC=CAM_ASM_000754 /LENGTH=251 /DNA_ID=CAMNT_0043218227 /DNA_START=35 /DNA_END=787 /DNA_ORIENTATION=+